MSSNPELIPFGLIFEERAPQPEASTPLVYDEYSDISYVRCADGRLVPCVEFSGAGRTTTETRVATESSDQDVEHPSRFTGTQTESKVWTEETDTDPSDDHSNARAWFGTHTMTAVRAESTDTDPGEDDARPLFRGSVDSRMISAERWLMIPGALIGTDTFTKAKGESTDKD